MKLFHFDIHIGKHRVLVQSRDIFNNSITGENIAPGAVTAEKIAPGAVGHEQLAPEAVEDLTRLEEELQGLINDVHDFLEMPYEDATDEEVAAWFENNNNLEEL